MAKSSFSKSLNNRIQRTYLGKWTIVGVSIGTIAGLGATAFYLLITLVTNYLLGPLTGYYPPNPLGEAAALPSIHPHFLLIPVATAIGGLIAGILVYRFAPEAEGHGTDEAIAAFHVRDGRIRRRVPVVKAIASAFTIGSGGSGGREGPTAQIAAGFGSYVGDLFGLSVHDRRVAVAVGIGAGIGSIFKSPFGGAILSGEILYSGGDFEIEALIPALIASALGYVIFGSAIGFTPIFGNFTYSFTHPINLIIYALLGAACGLVGRVYTISFYSTRKLFARLRISKYVRPMIGAIVAGVIGIFFPEVLGLGYGIVQILVNGNISMMTTNFFSVPSNLVILTLIALVFLKIIATSFTVGSGGSAGVFAPSLVIGAFVGATFFEAANFLVPGWIPSPGPLVIIGMMALFGGAGRVPIAVMLMVSEMTGTLGLLEPSMVAVVISFFVCGSKYTIYKSQVPRRVDSPAHIGDYNVPLLTKIHVIDAMNANVISMLPEDSVEKAYQLMLEKGFRGIPIVEAERVVGIVTMSDVQRVSREQMPVTQLKAVMTKNMLLADNNNTLLDVLDMMTTHGVGRLPVVSKDSHKLMGIITRTDVIRAYERIAGMKGSSDQSVL